MSNVESERVVPDGTLVFPESDDVPSGSEALAALDVATASLGTDTGAVVDEEPPPVGRSWAFDFAKGDFVFGPTRAPLATRGLQTLTTWIQKCLLTDRGAHPVYTERYGLVRAWGEIGEPIGSLPSGDLEVRISDALTYNDRITGIQGFTTNFDPDDDWFQVEFDVVIDETGIIPVRVTMPGSGV